MNMVELMNDINNYNECHNSTLDSIHQQLKDITEEWRNGEITDSEYKELLEDIKSMNIIAEGAAELNAQKQLNTIINVAITLAATAAKAI